MEASTLQPPASLAHPRILLGAPLLRLRSDEQLVALFRAGHDEAFRVIHDRYNKRLFAYARQMLPARQDAEDALQDVFVRAYAGLRASDRDLALRAWLFRVAHNRCVDELRKPTPPSPEVLQLVRTNAHDPLAEVDIRESLRRLVEDIRRLPEQQRSALLMRELAGLSYAELASSLGVSVGAVKSLLVRARLGLAQAAAARETACPLIREQLVEAHDRGIRPTANTRKHVRDCPGCKSFRRDLRGFSRQLAATAPTIGPLGFLAQLLGIPGGGGAAGGAGGGAALVGGGTASAGGLALTTGHVATLLVAAVATAGGAVEIQHTILPVAKHTAHVRRHAAFGHPAPAPLTTPTGAAAVQASAAVSAAAVGNDLRVTLAGRASSSHSTATHQATTGAATDPDTRSAATLGGVTTKRHAQSGPSTTTSTSTGTATTGASTTGTCTPGGTSAPAATGSSSSPSSPASSSTASAPPTGTTTAASTSATPSCTAGAGSSASTSAPSSGGSTTGTNSSTGTTTGTGAGSASSATANSDSSAGSASPSSSNVATG